MKHSKLLIAGTCLASLFAAVPAMASTANPDNWYVGVDGDLTWLRHSDMGGGGGVDLGYRFWPSNFGDFRIEGAANYNGAGGDSGYSSTHYFTYMGNLYYDFNTVFPSSNSGWHITPYIGGGLGDAEVHFGSSSFASTFHHHDNSFAYQGMAGLSFTSASMPSTDWVIGYRYLGTDQDNLHANNLEAGVRFNF